MHGRVPSARRPTVGAVFAFIAAALVAVFGITPAHAAGAARQAVGPSATETLAAGDPAAAWTTAAAVATVAATAADHDEDYTHGPAAATAPAPVRPAQPAAAFAVPAQPDDRTSSTTVAAAWGRAPPA